MVWLKFIVGIAFAVFSTAGSAADWAWSNGKQTNNEATTVKSPAAPATPISTTRNKTSGASSSVTALTQPALAYSGGTPPPTAMNPISIKEAIHLSDGYTLVYDSEYGKWIVLSTTEFNSKFNSTVRALTAPMWTSANWVFGTAPTSMGMSYNMRCLPESGSRTGFFNPANQTYTHASISLAGGLSVGSQTIVGPALHGYAGQINYWTPPRIDAGYANSINHDIVWNGVSVRSTIAFQIADYRTCQSSWYTSVNANLSITAHKVYGGYLFNSGAPSTSTVVMCSGEYSRSKGASYNDSDYGNQVLTNGFVRSGHIFDMIDSTWALCAVVKGNATLYSFTENGLTNFASEAGKKTYGTREGTLFYVSGTNKHIYSWSVSKNIWENIYMSPSASVLITHEVTGVTKK